MASQPVVLDGLWRCLCPSFQTSSLALRVTSLSRALCLVSSTHPTTIAPPARTRSHSTALSSPRSTTPKPPIYDHHRTPNHKAKAAGRDGEQLVRLSTSQLYELLRNDARKGRHWEVFNIVKFLLKNRRERPNSELYSAILRSYASAEGGTAGKLHKVLEEMAEEGIPLDEQGCHNVLEALAVHPDYLLRDEILKRLRDSWFTLNTRGQNMVVAGLLRERSFEQALQRIDEMVANTTRVEPWVYDMAIYLLLDHGEVDEAYQLLLMRESNCPTSISYTLWQTLLECASNMQQPEAVKHVWNTQVVHGYLKPSNDTCINILNVAAHSGDAKLATDVFRVLAERGIKFDLHHYEALLEAYLKAEDLSSALSIVVVMRESGLKMDEASLHPLQVFLRRDEKRPMQAFEILQDMEHSGRKVPTAAVNICLLASVHLLRLEEAIEIYKALHTVSRDGPTTTTFNILFKGCHQAGRKALAMFLASEMTQLRLKPDALTYDRLVHVCCESGDIEDAFAYYEEMRSEGFHGRRGMYRMLVEKGLEAGDVRTMALLKDMEKAGHVPDRHAVAAVHEKFDAQLEMPGYAGGSAGPPSLASESRLEAPAVQSGA